MVHQLRKDRFDSSPRKMTVLRIASLFFATSPFCAKLNLPTCGQASEVVYNMQVHFEAKHLL